MARILHACGWFDPAGDVVRCVDELNKYSKHRHDLVVRCPHPHQQTMQFKEPKRFHENRPVQVDLADAIICHFVGWPTDWLAPGGVPMAFRNLNIRYDENVDQFWCEGQFNAYGYGPYKLLSASHVGAMDFMPAERFRWLPDLVDMFSPAMTPDATDRAPAVSYIKHAMSMDALPLTMRKRNLHGSAHAKILAVRKSHCTVVLDNLCDGHWGLAGNEALSLALPTIVYNHPKTKAALAELTGSDVNPFIEVERAVGMEREPNPKAMAEVEHWVNHITEMEPEAYAQFRKDIRVWTVNHLGSENLIEKCWDPFVDELLGEI